jgi:hypothetical protein
MSDERIQGSVELWREDGQWRLLLHAPAWVLQDIQDTMGAQTHPQVLVLASGSYSNGRYENLHFTTWGGGAIGSPPEVDRQRVVTLKEHEPQSSESERE